MIITCKAGVVKDSINIQIKWERDVMPRYFQFEVQQGCVKLDSAAEYKLPIAKTSILGGSKS
jgi:hypothetical protein